MMNAHKILENVSYVIASCGIGLGGFAVYQKLIGTYTYKGEEKLHGKTVLITGANSGFGRETAYDLAKRGARIIMACRNIEACEAEKTIIVNDTFNKNVACRKLDLASLKSVREFASEFNTSEKRLDILINNAGHMGYKQRTVTEDNFESHLGINYLGHFLLTHLLMGKLRHSAPSRIINIGCVDYHVGEFNFDDFNMKKSYAWMSAYGTSKLALMYFTEELDKKLTGSDVQAFCAFPGLAFTNINRNHGWYKSHISRFFWTPFYWLGQRTAHHGAQVLIHCATKDNLTDRTSEDFCLFHGDCLPLKFLNAYEFNAETSQRLWATAEAWTQIAEHEKLEHTTTKQSVPELTSSNTS